MQLFGRELNIRLFMYTKCLPALIIADLFLITLSLIFYIPNNISQAIQQFDWIVCIILLGEYFINLYKSSPKKDYILDKENIIGLIASIPFDLILLYTPIVLPFAILRYLRLFKLIRVVKLAQFDYIKDLFKKTGLHKILLAITLVIVSFTLLFMVFGPSFNGLDDLYYVIVTLTTVGYGDMAPVTHNEKVLAIILILIGIFAFSTITAAISSFLTDRILDEDEDDIMLEVNKNINEKTEIIQKELKNVREENKMLKDEIHELKELIKNK